MLIETSVSSCVGVLKTTSGGGAADTRIGSVSTGGVSVGALPSWMPSPATSSHSSPRPVLHDAGDFEPASGVEPGVEREVEALALRLRAADPDGRVGRAQHEIVPALAGRIRQVAEQIPAAELAR